MQSADLKTDDNHRVLIEVLKTLSLRFPNAELSKKLNYSKGNISNFIKGSKPVPDTFLDNLFTTFNVDKENILKKIESKYKMYVEDSQPTGNGTMLKDDEIGYPKQLKAGKSKKQLYYPDVVVTNSDVELFDKLSSGDVEVREMYDPNLEGSDVVLPNFGNSNAPYIQSGDLVGYRKLDIRSYESLNLDLMYMIITVNGQRMNKKLQVYKEDNSKLLCVSINKNEYNPFPILKEDILELWEVVGVSRRFN